jgi:hypothetical protein
MGMQAMLHPLHTKRIIAAGNNDAICSGNAIDEASQVCASS